MIKKIIIYILIAVGIVGSLAGQYALADETNDAYSYAFYLYYDNGKLIIDRDAKYPYDIVARETSLNVTESATAFRAEIINFQEKIAQTFFIDPLSESPDFKKGKLVVQTPYVPDGQEVNFYDQSGKKILTIPLGDSAVCNNNAICESSAGESFNNCPTDCKAIVPSVAASQTPVPATPTQSGINRGLTIGLSVLVIILLGGAAAWIIIKRRRPPVLATSNQSLIPKSDDKK